MSTTRIMKRFGAGSDSATVAFNYDDMEQRLADYKAQIAEECRQEILKAHEDAERIRSKAQTDGHAEGYRHGLSQAEHEVQEQAEVIAQQLVEERLQPVLPAVSSLLNQIATEHVRRQAEVEAEVVNLALAIAEKIIRIELTIRPERIREIISHALRLVIGKPNFSVLMNASDLTLLGDRLDGIIREANQGVAVKVTASDSVSSGGCVVATEHGRIDAQIETMLARIRTEILEGG